MKRHLVHWKNLEGKPKVKEMTDGSLTVAAHCDVCICFGLEGDLVQFTNVWRKNQKGCMLESGCLNVEMVKRVVRTLKGKPPYYAV